MRVTKRQPLNDFIRRHNQASKGLLAWWQVASTATWRSIHDVRATYPQADVVGAFTVFNIKGNDYRLIILIDYARQVIYIRDILTHEEYDRDRWKGK